MHIAKTHGGERLDREKEQHRERPAIGIGNHIAAEPIEGRKNKIGDNKDRRDHEKKISASSSPNFHDKDHEMLGVCRL